MTKLDKEKMSLDVYLKLEGKKLTNIGSGIFLRENGSTRSLSWEEYRAKFPKREPAICHEWEESDRVFTANITHNLGTMARQAGVYKTCWRPQEIGVEKAAQLIPLLSDGLTKLKDDPDYFRQFNPPNGWGNYEILVDFLERYLLACQAYPDSTVSVSR